MVRTFLLLLVLASPAVGQVVTPRTDDPELQAIFEKAYWYTEKQMPKTYQQPVQLQRNATFHNAYYVIGPDPFGYGNGNREWPWSDPSTLADDDRNVTNVVGMVLPNRSGRTIPIVVYQADRRTPVNNLPIIGVTAWKFPVGTEFVEIVSNQVGGKPIPFKVLRATKNAEGGWDRKAYRPFPTAQDYADALNESVSLSESRTAKLTARHPGDRKQFTAEVVKLLRPVPADVTETLLRETPFKECLGKEFHANAFAPTTDHANQIVPRNYVGNFFSRDNEDCNRCHKDTLTHVAWKEQVRDWYGFIRGSDQIFSFHPIDPRSISQQGATIQPRLRPEFVQRGWVKNRDATDDPNLYGGFQ